MFVDQPSWVRAQQGDGYWAIAARLGWTGRARDAAAQAIQQANGLADLYPGQYVAIPPEAFGPVNASGLPLPVTAAEGWRIESTEDYDVDVPLGAFPDKSDDSNFLPVYPTLRWYPHWWADTSKRGRYIPREVFSVENSMIVKHIHCRPDGQPVVGVLLPGGWGGRTSARYTICARFPDKLPGYKVAWLLWPREDSDLDGKMWPDEGEIDFPETGLTALDAVNGYVHRMNATSGNDQHVLGKTPVDMTQWNTYTIEYVAGTSVSFALNGVVLKSWTDRIPQAPMRWCIQTETVLDTSVMIDPTVAGRVEIDWTCIEVPLI
jgi:hypothetical protein